MWDKIQNQVFLGNKEFVEEKRKLIDAEKDLSEIPAGQKRVLPKPLDFFVNKTESRDEAIVAAVQDDLAFSGIWHQVKKGPERLSKIWEITKSNKAM